jgi:hypothetical protein
LPAFARQAPWPGHGRLHFLGLSREPPAAARPAFGSSDTGAVETPKMTEVRCECLARSPSFEIALSYLTSVKAPPECPAGTFFDYDEKPALLFLAVSSLAFLRKVHQSYPRGPSRSNRGDQRANSEFRAAMASPTQRRSRRLTRRRPSSSVSMEPRRRTRPDRQLYRDRFAKSGPRSRPSRIRAGPPRRGLRLQAAGGVGLRGQRSTVSRARFVAVWQRQATATEDLPQRRAGR